MMYSTVQYSTGQDYVYDDVVCIVTIEGFSKSQELGSMGSHWKQIKQATVPFLKERSLHEASQKKISPSL